MYTAPNVLRIVVKEKLTLRNESASLFIPLLFTGQLLFVLPACARVGRIGPILSQVVFFSSYVLALANLKIYLFN